MPDYMQFVLGISAGVAIYVFFVGVPPKYVAIPLACALGLLWLSVPVLMIVRG